MFSFYWVVLGPLTLACALLQPAWEISHNQFWLGFVFGATLVGASIFCWRTRHDVP